MLQPIDPRTIREWQPVLPKTAERHPQVRGCGYLVRIALHGHESHYVILKDHTYDPIHPVVWQDNQTFGRELCYERLAQKRLHETAETDLFSRRGAHGDALGAGHTDLQLRAS